jgi:citronellol/citronellal dehydrogenase
MPDAEFGLSDADLAQHATVYAEGSWAGRAVLVSGGAGGIGRACAWLLGRLGARLMLTGRDAAKLEQAAAAMRARGLSVETLAADIREPEAVAALFATATERLGPLDLLVNSAGGQFPKAAIEISSKGWNAVVGTNLTGTWLMMQAAAQAWQAQGRGGGIVNIVVVTEHGLHGVAHTVAARAGVIGLTRALAVEWAPLGIRLNCVAPGAIETPGWRVYSPEAVATYPKTNPMMRAGTAWEVAEAVAYLGSPAAAYVTGELLHVAGGSQLWGETWTIPRPAWFSG